jgi:hypothetical protein
MEVDENKLLKSKEKLRADLEEYFTKIEIETEEPLPKDFLDIVYDVLEALYPLSEQEAIVFLKEFPDIYQEGTEFFEREGRNLQPICKKLIDKLLIDLFQVTDGKGIGNALWFHFPKIWHYYRVIQDMKPSPDRVETDFFILMSLYVSLYEMTLKFLTDFALIIAKKTKQKNRASQTLLNQYSKATQKDKSLSRFELLQFFKKRDYLIGGKCDVLENTIFRDKPAHADAYVNQNKKIVIGKVKYEMEDFYEIYKRLLEFYGYIIFTYLRESGVNEQICRTKEIMEKISICDKL